MTAGVAATACTESHEKQGRKRGSTEGVFVGGGRKEG